MFFKPYFFLFLFMILISLTSFGQNEKITEKEEKNKIFQVTEENLQFLMENKPFVLIYFYSSYNPDSLKMKNLIPLLQIINNPAVFVINIDTNLGLRNTFQIHNVPSLVVLKNRKIIYGLTGYIDDKDFLTDFINNGIQNNLYE